MYTQTFLVTSVRGRPFAPQTAASASLSFFGAKMPLPAFFMANAFFLPVALWAFFPIVRFSALIVFNVAFVIVVFVVFATVVFATVLVVVESSTNWSACPHCMSRGKFVTNGSVDIFNVFAL